MRRRLVAFVLQKLTLLSASVVEVLDEDVLDRAQFEVIDCLVT